MSFVFYILDGPLFLLRRLQGVPSESFADRTRLGVGIQATYNCFTQGGIAKLSDGLLCIHKYVIAAGWGPKRYDEGFNFDLLPPQWVNFILIRKKNTLMNKILLILVRKNPKCNLYFKSNTVYNLYTVKDFKSYENFTSPDRTQFFVLSA